MKKNHSLILTALCASMLFSNCTKIGVKWPHGHHNSIQEGDICRITKVMQLSVVDNSERNGIFYYSDNGNLDSVVYDKDGAVNFWKYDDQNRLIEYRTTLEHDLDYFLTLHRYASEGDKVVRDTTWLVGASGWIIQVWTLEYDSKGRVARETGIRVDDQAYGTQLTPITYHYDSRGNSQNAEGTLVYDNEINFLRTNKVLQLIQRNYSMNNVAQYMLGYNTYGLPVACLRSGGFLGGDSPSKIQYSCVPIPGGGNYGDGCRFETFKQEVTRYYGTASGTFYYTPDGRPLSIVFQPVENYMHRFVYDKHDRLTQYYSGDNGMFGDMMHRYGYTNGRITTDTTELYNSTQMLIQVSTLSYDNLGRIVTEEIHVTERDFVHVSEYSKISYKYDANGNLISPLVTDYDNKINYLRTNPVWMFIHRNYSRNNPQGIVTNYNSKGLPLGFSKKVFGFIGGSEPTELTYACEESSVTSK